MRRPGLRLWILVLLAPLLVWALPAAADEYDLDLGDVMDGNAPGVTAAVSGVGGYYGSCMGAQLTNETGQTLLVRIPVGMRLVPPDAGVQTMVTAGGEVLEVPPGASEFTFVAFCSEMSDRGPSGTSGFTNGGIVEDDDLLAVLERIAEEGDTSSDAQAAVWSVTDDLAVGENEAARRFIDGGGVDDGRAALGGAAAGAMALGVAEVMRRMTLVKQGATEGGSSTGGDPDDPGDALDEPGYDEKTEPTSDSTDAGADEAGDDREPHQPPKPPAPVRAGDSQVGLRWDPTRKRLVYNDGHTTVEVGRGGGWIGSGGAPGPGTNPFTRPPDVDITDGRVTAHRRGDQFDAAVPTAGGRTLHLFRDSAENTTRLQRGHLVLSRAKDRVAIQDLISGRTTGAAYDGSTRDFEAFRANFRLAREDGTFSLSDKTRRGRVVSAEYNPDTHDARIQSGRRVAVRSGEQFGYSWGKRMAGYDRSTGFGMYEFPTDAGRGQLTIGLGRGGQVGVARTQPLQIGDRQARLNLEYSKMLRDTGGLDSELSAGLDVGRVTVSWTRGTKPEFRYRFASF